MSPGSSSTRSAPGTATPRPWPIRFGPICAFCACVRRLMFGLSSTNSPISANREKPTARRSPKWSNKRLGALGLWGRCLVGLSSSWPRAVAPAILLVASSVFAGLGGGAVAPAAAESGVVVMTATGDIDGLQRKAETRPPWWRRRRGRCSQSATTATRKPTPRPSPGATTRPGVSSRTGPTPSPGTTTTTPRTPSPTSTTSAPPPGEPRPRLVQLRRRLVARGGPQQQLRRRRLRRAGRVARTRPERPSVGLHPRLLAPSPVHLGDLGRRQRRRCLLEGAL